MPVIAYFIHGLLNLAEAFFHAMAVICGLSGDGSVQIKRALLSRTSRDKRRVVGVAGRSLARIVASVYSLVIPGRMAVQA